MQDVGGTPVSGAQCLLSSQVALEFGLNKNRNLKIVLISTSHLERHTPHRSKKKILHGS